MVFGCCLMVFVCLLSGSVRVSWSQWLNPSENTIKDFYKVSLFSSPCGTFSVLFNKQSPLVEKHRGRHTETQRQGQRFTRAPLGRHRFGLTQQNRHRKQTQGEPSEELKSELPLGQRTLRRSALISALNSTLLLVTRNLLLIHSNQCFFVPYEGISAVLNQPIRPHFRITGVSWNTENMTCLQVPKDECYKDLVNATLKFSFQIRIVVTSTLFPSNPS